MKKKHPIQTVFIFNIFKLFICLGVTCMVFWGCGSSESDPLNTGVFIDGEIEGLEFQSGHRAGITDSSGKFYFAENETVTFTIGGLMIGEPAAAKELMSPIDLVDEPDAFVTHPTVTNICRLLLSLDVNGDPDDGIFISQAIRDIIRDLVENGLGIQFDVPMDDFGDQTGIQTLLDTLNTEGVFTDGIRTLVTSESAWTHFYATLADYNATPTVMINLGDGLTNGTQSGFGNVHQYTQVAGFAAYISYQLDAASELVWQNPMLEITDEERNFSRLLEDDEIKTPYNLGVDGATTKSLVYELTGSGNDLLDELMLPIPEDSETEVTQLDAALYVAGLHPDRLKIFTVWIGAQDSLAAAFRNGGTELTETAISDYLNDTDAGHDLDSVKANLDDMVESLRQVPYAYVFIATIPHVDTLGCFFSKSDIEALAVYDNPSVTAIGEDELIGFDPFIGDISQVETSISRALNSDDATLNAAILQVLADDANFLSPAEIDLINTRVDTINAHIEALSLLYDNVVLVDMKTYYDQLKNGGVPTAENVLNKRFGGGFFSLDGYHPSYSGNADIANRFIQEINAMEIGLDIEELDIDALVLPIDPYNLDADADGFLANPGMIPELISVPVYDPLLKGWIDCDDDNDAVFPENVSGDECL